MINTFHETEHYREKLRDTEKGGKKSDLFSTGKHNLHEKTLTYNI